MEDLELLRREIDRIDRQIVALFEQRMAITRRVGLYKLEHDIPVLDKGREEQVLADKAALLHDKALLSSVTELFEAMMDISRRQQSELARSESGGDGGLKKRKKHNFSAERD